jgi:hypothetical protein
MIDNFFAWFWSRRSPAEKFFFFAGPVDGLVALGLQLTSIPGIGILALLVITTMLCLGIFCLSQFICSEYSEYKKEKDAEAERIVKALKGESEKYNAVEELKRYRAIASITKSKLVP